MCEDKILHRCIVFSSSIVFIDAQPHNRFLNLQAFIGSQDINQDFDALEAVQREAARQVAYHCSEQGQVLIKVSHFSARWPGGTRHIKALE